MTPSHGVSGEIGYIQLMRRDGTVRAFAIVDAADFEWLARRRWYRNSNGYAYGTVRAAGHRIALAMHRVVLGGPPGQVDHINGDRLDNRRANLRCVTNAENAQNRAACRNNPTGYRGVSIDRSIGRYRASVTLNGKKHWIGTHYDTPEAAAVAASAFRAAHMPFAEQDKVSA